MGWLSGERTANGLALHGSTQAAVDTEGWYNFALDWIRALGCQPDRIAIGGAGYSSSDNVRSFAAGSRKLRETGFGVVSSITLSATGDASTAGTLFRNWTAECAIDCRSGTVYFCWDSQVQALAETNVAEVFLSLRTFYDGRYGYTFTRAFRMGPNLFPMGMLAGLEGSENRPEAERISKWAHFLIEVGRTGSFPCSVLRDVYESNLLSDNHLEMLVDGTPFADWIGVSSSRGSLLSLTDGLWLWKVSSKNIPAVFEVLGQRRLIVCYGSFAVESGGPCGHAYGPWRAGVQRKRPSPRH